MDLVTHTQYFYNPKIVLENYTNVDILFSYNIIRV